jgi:hypothetical protein
MGITPPIDDRNLVTLRAELITELIDENVLPTGIRQSGYNFPLVDAMIGDIQDVLAR